MQSSRSFFNLLFFSALSIALMITDHRHDYLRNVHHYFGTISYPIYYLANLPVRFWDQVYIHLHERGLLKTQNQTLREENMQLHFQLQKYSAVLSENQRLRNLLQSTRNQVDNKAIIAELISKNSTPFKQRIVINKGARDNAYIGQPILGTDGILGQIISVTPFSATGMLISDPDHAVLAQVNRSGITTLVVGVGNPDQLELQYLPPDADIRQGDTLVTTGLDNLYPPDYPIGYVTKVSRSPGDTFASVFIRPFAKLNYGREVLLIWERSVSPAPEPK